MSVEKTCKIIDKEFNFVLSKKQGNAIKEVDSDWRAIEEEQRQRNKCRIAKKEKES